MTDRSGVSKQRLEASFQIAALDQPAQYRQPIGGRRAPAARQPLPYPCPWSCLDIPIYDAWRLFVHGRPARGLSGGALAHFPIYG